jgi:hypothetical protein
MIMVKNDKVILYGGTASTEEQIQNKSMKLLNDLYIFNYKQLLWEEPMIGGNYPFPRYNFTFCSNFPQITNVSGEYIILGGVEEPFAKSSYVDMKMHILSQTEGQNWKIESKMKYDTEASFVEDDDESFSMTQPKQTVYLSDQEILEEEYGKAENTIQKLKQEVSEMEINLKQEKLRNITFKEDTHENEEKKKALEADISNFIKAKDKEIGDLAARKSCNTTIVSNLLESLAIKIKQRKIIQVRILALEQGMSAAEDFIVHLDRLFSDAIQRRPRPNLRNVPRQRREGLCFQRNREEEGRAHADFDEIEERIRRDNKGRSQGR